MQRQFVTRWGYGRQPCWIPQMTGKLFYHHGVFDHRNKVHGILAMAGWAVINVDVKNAFD